MPTIIEHRKEQLAINAIDLDALDPILRIRITRDKEGNNRLDFRQAIPVETEKASSTRAIAFCCDLLTAALCCDLTRSENRREGGPIIRVYLKKADAWTRLPEKAILTLVEEGKPILNPEIFPMQVRPSDLMPLAPRRLY